MRKWILKMWINHKVNKGRRKGWIKPIAEELAFMGQKVKEDIQGLHYIEDKTAIGVQWDFQYDCTEVFRRGGADCNSLNRVWQCFFERQGFIAYLVTYLHHPSTEANLWKFYNPKNGITRTIYRIMNLLGIALAHTTCILQDRDGKWYSADYGKVFPEDSFTASLAYVAANVYGVIPTAVYVQDINFNEVKGL